MSDDGKGRPGERLARTLGVASVALGAPLVAAPGRVARFVGLDDTAGTRAVARGVGLRELAAAAAILPRSRPLTGVWGRVAGDGLDLALLGVALRSAAANRRRLVIATGAVAGIAALDAIGALRLTRRRHPTKVAEDGSPQVSVGVTVNRSAEEAYALWRDFARLPVFMTHLVSVTDEGKHWVATAPGGGTVEWDAEIVEDRAGRAAVLALGARRGRGQRRHGDLRRRAGRAGDRGAGAAVVRPAGRQARHRGGPTARRGAATAGARRPAPVQADPGDRRGGPVTTASPEGHRSQPRLARRNDRSQPDGERRMKATCWMGRNKVSVETVPDPEILNARDAIVKITSTAICGSDLHLYDGYIPTMRKGDVLGHEFMGEVVELGPAVTNLAVGDRVVVPFPIACGACFTCERGLYSVCENSNPNAGIAEKLMGHSPAGIFGYSHMLGGYPGGQAEYARVPFADVGPLKIEDDLADEQVLFLTDIFPTGYMGAEMCDIKPGDVVAVWGAGPVGHVRRRQRQPAGRGRVIVIDRFAYRLKKTAEHTGAETINYADVDIRGRAQRDDRRPRSGRVHRRRRHGGPPRQPGRVRVRPGQAGDPAGDRAAARAARGDPGLPHRRDRLDRSARTAG